MVGLGVAHACLPPGGEGVAITKDGGEPASKHAAPAAAAVLDKSIVVLPQQAGGFVHERSRVGTVEVPQGVAADYRAPGQPGDPWIAVAVVPTCRVDEASAVAAQAQALEQSLRGQRTLVALKLLPAASIRVDAPDRGSLYANRRTGATRGWALPASVGSRQSFTYMDRDGELTRSAGLVFHRDLADIEVRVRLPADAMGQAAFDALADEAARRIVPAIDIRNFGRCPVPARDHNCAADEAAVADAAPIDGVAHALVFPRVPAPGGCRRNGVAVACN